jgi:phosphopantothenoylcysteine decarboxylase/phosphopantothenate--cysteine ligase
MVNAKNIVLGVAGSIAAYKAVYLVRLCVEAGAEVWPILTASGARFVGPLTFSALTRHRAIVDMWSASEAGEISHVEIARRADALVLAPATADLLARLAVGRADDPLCAVALATRAPWIVAPAMETGMWENPATQAAVTTLRERGASFVMPGEGHLASGAHGVGRMAEPEVILETIARAVTVQDLAGQRVLVTAGPTRERFDPVRFVTNASSGKMGFAVARVARRRGAEVILVTGPTTLKPPSGVKVEQVESTYELLEACRRHLASATVLVMAAAPADFRPAERAPTKAKKKDKSFSVDMEPTIDVLKTLAPRAAGIVTVGFAAETDNLVAKAQHKLVDKNLDLMVANDVTRTDAGFASDTNVVEIINRGGEHAQLPVMPKESVASEILDRIAALVT